jgi:hypothetical protein
MLVSGGTELSALGAAGVTVEATPTTVSLPTAAPCAFDAGAIISDASASTASRLRPTTGTWTMSSIDTRKGGRTTGSIALSLTSDAGTITIHGDYDLEITRIPVEGDWPPDP